MQDRKQFYTIIIFVVWLYHFSICISCGKKFNKLDIRFHQFSWKFTAMAGKNLGQMDIREVATCGYFWSFERKYAFDLHFPLNDCISIVEFVLSYRTGHDNFANTNWRYQNCISIVIYKAIVSLEYEVLIFVLNNCNFLEQFFRAHS